MAPRTGFESRVREELEASSPVDQDDFVSRLENTGMERGEVLKSIRVLMEQDEVSYTLDWNLHIEKQSK